LAPRPIAWVCAGFEIDDRVLADVRGLTSLEVSIWSTTAGGIPQLMSTLPPEERGDLVASMSGMTSPAHPVETTMPLANATYATLLQTLRTADGTRVNTLLQRSLDEARKPFETLELQIFALSALLLLIAVAAAVTFSRTVTRPLRVLADGAGRIERGDYITPIVVKQQDEIGQLATAFNEMQSG